MITVGQSEVRVVIKSVFDHWPIRRSRDNFWPIRGQRSVCVILGLSTDQKTNFAKNYHKLSSAWRVAGGRPLIGRLSHTPASDWLRREMSAKVFTQRGIDRRQKRSRPQQISPDWLDNHPFIPHPQTILRSEKHSPSHHLEQYLLSQCKCKPG